MIEKLSNFHTVYSEITVFEKILTCTWNVYLSTYEQNTYSNCMYYKNKSIPNKGLLNPSGLRTRLALSSISSLACLRSSLSSGLLKPIGLRLLPKDPKTLKNSKIRTF